MFKLVNRMKNRKGFTLIELIVVIAILGILALIAIPRLGGFRDSAELSADKASAAVIAKAAEMYAASNNVSGVSISDISPELVAEEETKSQKNGNEFVLKYEDGMYKVYYDEESDPLYPEN